MDIIKSLSQAKKKNAVLVCIKVAKQIPRGSIIIELYTNFVILKKHFLVCNLLSTKQPFGSLRYQQIPTLSLSRIIINKHVVKNI